VNGVQFKTADFLFQCAEMLAENIDELLNLWAESMKDCNNCPPFESHDHVYKLIDATLHGNAPWKCFTISYNGEATQPHPTWQISEWEVFYCDPDVVLSQMLGNPDFDGQFDYAAYVELDKAGMRCWNDFMLGNFAYR
jgi:Plavaka transposase